MTYSPLQIEIIKAFGSKKLSEGCLIISPYHDKEMKVVGLIGDESELASIDIYMKEILKLISEGMTPKHIKKKLSTSEYRIRKIMKEAKALGYTKMYNYGGSGCTCKFNESVNWCECGGAPFVGRQTVMTEKGMEYLKSN